MTLIVAGVDGLSVWMVSDTALTDPTAKLRDRKNCPKVEPLNGCSLVGFTGVAADGLQIIRGVSNLEPGPATLEALVREQRNCQNVEFAYAYIDGTAPRLFQVSEGTPNERTTLHLGSQAAFETFQRIRHDRSISHPPSAVQFFLSDDIGDRVSEAIMTMIRLFSSTNDREVGGWAVPYVLSASGAKLCSYAFSVSDPIVDQLSTGDTLPFGTAAAGGFAVSVTELRERDGLVVYWLQKEKGEIWLRSKDGYTSQSFEGSPTLFKEAVKAQLGREVDLWFGDKPLDPPAVVEVLRDQDGRPRLSMGISRDELAFAWIQSTADSFVSEKRISLIEQQTRVREDGSGHRAFTVTPCKDEESVVLRVTTGDHSEAEISLRAAQLDELIALLGTARMSLKDAVPTDIPEGTKLTTIIDPVWRTRSQLPFQDGCLLVLRHPGLGWVSFLLPPHEARAIGEWLVHHAGPDSK